MYEAQFPSKMARIAAALADLLHDHPWQAGVMQALARAASQSDVKALETLYASGDIWGGSGSVFDVNLQNPEAKKAHCSLLVELVQSFEDAGIRFAPAKARASICAEWLSSGVFDKG
ncbi:MAG: hypothetical protein AB1429_07400 [Pseudomonadota bacterium]|jgi:hypothetical protein